MGIFIVRALLLEKAKFNSDSKTRSLFYHIYMLYLHYMLSVVFKQPLTAAILSATKIYFPDITRDDHNE